MTILIPKRIHALRKTEWGKDKLSKFIEDTNTNCYKTFLDHPFAFERLQFIYDLYEELTKIKLPRHSILPLFVFRSLGAYLGAVRLSMGGQICEGYTLQRNALEYALYGLVIANDDKAADIWVKRGTDKKSTKACRDYFRWGTVLQKLRDIDIDLSNKIESLYEHAIDNGAHPNVDVASTTSEFTDAGVTVDLLSAGSLPWKICIQQTFYVGLRSLQVIYHSIPKELRSSDIHNRLEQLEQEKFGDDKPRETL